MYPQASHTATPHGTAFKAGLALVWLTMLLSGMVKIEPAPYDILMLVVLACFALGGMRFSRDMMPISVLLGLFVIFSAIGSTQVTVNIPYANRHVFITLYLVLAVPTLIGLAANYKMPMLKAIWSGYTASALISSALGVIGYFDLVPGAFETLTDSQRASGFFKDPNVFGPFVVPPILYHTYLVLTGQLSKRTLWHLLIILICTFACLLSFSRGAWGMLAVGFFLTFAQAFIFAPSSYARQRLILPAIAGLIILMITLTAALQIPKVKELFIERAVITKSYDTAPEGRFGTQAHALKLGLENPFGLGAGEFSARYSLYDPHNAYIKAITTAGWPGFLFYTGAVLMTLWTGARMLNRRSEYLVFLVPAWASFAGIALESLIIDTDHWRQFYWLMGMVWGSAALIRGPYICAAARARRRAVPGGAALAVRLGDSQWETEPAAKSLKGL